MWSKSTKKFAKEKHTNDNLIVWIKFYNRISQKQKTISVNSSNAWYLKKKTFLICFKGASCGQVWTTVRRRYCTKTSALWSVQFSYASLYRKWLWVLQVGFHKTLNPIFSPWPPLILDYGWLYMMEELITVHFVKKIIGFLNPRESENGFCVFLLRSGLNVAFYMRRMEFPN